MNASHLLMKKTGQRILIAEHQAVVRSALRGFLQGQPGLIVVGEAADSQELLAGLEAACPDLVLLDWDLPGESAAALISFPRQANCLMTPIIVLGVRPESAPAAMDAGADAFVYKGDGPNELLTVIRSVLMRGEDTETNYAEA
jgi:DNA-binding NarL/FixJ family response regulator